MNNPHDTSNYSCSLCGGIPTLRLIGDELTNVGISHNPGCLLVERKSRVGWICPICGKANAPSVLSCCNQVTTGGAKPHD